LHVNAILLSLHGDLLSVYTDNCIAIFPKLELELELERNVSPLANLCVIFKCKLRERAMSNHALFDSRHVQLNLHELARS